MEAGGVKAGQRGRGSPPSTTTSTAPAKSRRGGIISSQWPSRAPIIRLVCADGSVRDISEAVSAAEALSLQDHESIAATASGRGSCSKLVGSSSGSSASLICDSAALRVGKRACPMHPDAQLEEGHLYYVLPIPAFQHRLRWSYISYLAAMAAAAAPSTSSSSAAPPASLPSFSSSLARIPLLINFLLRRRRRRHRGTLSTKVDDAEMRSGAGANSPAKKLLQLHSGTADCRRAFHNVCNYSPEANNKYVEQLIERSQSWRPPLLTIHE